MPKLSVYLPDDLYIRLIADLGGNTLSGVIQAALNEYLPALPVCPHCGQAMPIEDSREVKTQ